MEKGSLVQARVIRARPGGLELKIGPLHAFMPRSQTGLARGEDPAQLAGRNVTCEVIEVDAERQRVIVSRRVVLQRERESAHQRDIDALKPGEVVQCRVTRIEPFGVFVRFGRGLEGLIHVSNLAHERVEDPASVLAVGQVLDAKVLSLKRGGKRIALGLKQMTASPWRALEQRGWGPGQIVEGEVTRVADYGAFVAVLPGVEGLLHRSQTGLAPQRGVATLFAPGQRVSVRILDVDVEGERLSLSLLHEGGARIEPGEAASRSAFEELVRADEPRAGGFRLGARLRAALGEPPHDAEPPAADDDRARDPRP
jgi:small subunit ribosomal protein S1